MSLDNQTIFSFYVTNKCSVISFELKPGFAVYENGVKSNKKMKTGKEKRKQFYNCRRL